jgi:hypothetical protein
MSNDKQTPTFLRGFPLLGFAIPGEHNSSQGLYGVGGNSVRLQSLPTDYHELQPVHNGCIHVVG